LLGQAIPLIENDPSDLIGGIWHLILELVLFLSIKEKPGVRAGLLEKTESSEFINT